MTRLSVTGAVGGAVLVPLMGYLQRRDLFDFQIGETCNGYFVELVFGPPCDHEVDDGGGPDAYDPWEQERHRGWTHEPPAAEA